MRELIKSDIKRMLKDKLILIACIIGGAFAIITPLLYKAIFGLLEVEEMLGMLVDAKSQYFASFSPANNFGRISATAPSATRSSRVTHAARSISRSLSPPPPSSPRL